MATIVTRAGKGSPLTNTEVDANFTNLNTDKVENLGDLGITSTATELNKLDGFTGTKDDLNYAKDLRATGVTSTEYDYLDGVTSNIQTQLNAKIESGDTVASLDINGGTIDGATIGATTPAAGTVTELDLSAIDASIADTAVDIFIYDTRKDSDGGAWRKRTQHTSWYNETLNTATRGSRREFPAVAVIVADNSANHVTIYDGDDPSLPMWMVFNEAGSYGGGTANLIGNAGVTFSSVAAFNGEIVVTVSSESYPTVNRINFVKDNATYTRNSGTAILPAYLSERNDGVLKVPSFSGSAIVNNVVNDVAMTVLPNAPIDSATGLPVPTIAVATNGGVSVIKDDGTVVDESTGQTYDFVSFDQDRLIGGRSGGGTNEEVRCWFYPTYLSDSFAFDVQYKRSLSVPSLSSEDNSDATQAFGGSYIANGIPSGLNIINQDLSHKPNANSEKGDIAYITSSYNTGWMNGDIKLATLSDTDATNVTGTELIDQAGDIEDPISEWTLGVGTASITSASQFHYLKIKPNGSNIPVGRYVVTFTVASGGTTYGFYQDGTGYLTSSLTTGDYVVQLNQTSNVEVKFVINTGNTVSITNISVRLAEADRSVNNKGLQVFGTVTKTPVATGADLVAYSGFSDNTNYFYQPPNSGMDFGTGDFSVMLWHYHEDATLDDTIYFAAGKSSNTSWQVGAAGSDQSYLWVMDGIQARTSSGSVIEQRWTHLAYVRRNGQTEIWVNSVLQATGSGGHDCDTNEGIEIPSITSCGDGNDLLSLLRISATAPSAEQILKIYNDEKVLFQENAQATLYGSSDAVTALAYDDDTNLLHVGTSAGRSVFQGLRRVDNTTDAVGAAISASGGMVADD
jgi:hypothetical protein